MYRFLFSNEAFTLRNSIGHIGEKKPTKQNKKRNNKQTNKKNTHQNETLK